MPDEARFIRCLASAETHFPGHVLNVLRVSGRDVMHELHWFEIELHQPQMTLRVSSGQQIV